MVCGVAKSVVTVADGYYHRFRVPASLSARQNIPGPSACQEDEKQDRASNLTGFKVGELGLTLYQFHLKNLISPALRAPIASQT